MDWKSNRRLRGAGVVLSGQVDFRLSAHMNRPLIRTLSLRRDDIMTTQPGHFVLIERGCQAVKGDYQHDDALPEFHHFSNLNVVLGLDSSGLSVCFIRIEPVAFDKRARQVCDEKL
jgi:hypothetical protein